MLFSDEYLRAISMPSVHTAVLRQVTQNAFCTNDSGSKIFLNLFLSLVGQFFGCDMAVHGIVGNRG